jgi:hypothetical protein
MLLMETGLVVGYNIAQAYGSTYGVQEEGFSAATMGGMMLSSSVNSLSGAIGTAKNIVGTGARALSFGKDTLHGAAALPAKFAS